MTTTVKKPMKEAKRLSKSVKKRRQFAQNLREVAVQVRADSQKLDIVSGQIEMAFADRLDTLADVELAAARTEEAEHRKLSDRNAALYATKPRDPEQEARAARALGVLAVQGSSARVRHIADSFKVGVDGSYSASELLKMIEDMLDREGLDHADKRDGLLFGQRIVNAEKLLFGSPRF